MTIFSPKQTSFKQINIAGAGIAGMTAAINLKLSYQDVVVFEKGTTVGSNRHGDHEGLENWIFEGSMDSFFQDHGFDLSRIDTIPIHTFTVHSSENIPFEVRSTSPFFYMIQRGAETKHFDQQLYKQCQEAGVEFNFSQKAPDHVEIDSTGTRRAAAYIKGINFHSSLPDQVHLLLGSIYAPKGYAYLIILNGHGTIATAFKKNNKIKDPLKNTLQFYSQLGFNIPSGTIFGSRGSFSLMKMNFIDRPVRIGEAGGYQDLLFGFGMRMAMNSGLAAAHLFNGDLDTANKIMKELDRKRKVSYVNRLLYERLNEGQLLAMAKRFTSTQDPINILSNAYEWNFRNIMRWMKQKGNVEVRTA